MFMYVRVCVCRCVYSCVHMCVCGMCVQVRSWMSIFSQSHSSLLFGYRVMLNLGLTDSTGQVGQQAWGIHLTRPPQCLDYIHALTHSVFYVGTGNSNPGPQWCITHSYECSDLYEVYLLVWIYFKMSHWDSSITLTLWHTFGLEDLTDLRNLEHLRFQKFVSSLVHEEGSKHVPCCRKHLWNIKAVFELSHVLRKTHCIPLT